MTNKFNEMTYREKQRYWNKKLKEVGDYRRKLKKEDAKWQKKTMSQ